jgi:predicted RNase H-like nuclease (RuvC/YqgF family)
LDEWGDVFVSPQEYQSTNWPVVGTLRESIQNRIQKWKNKSALRALLLEKSEDVIQIGEKLNLVHNERAQQYQPLLSRDKTYQSQTWRLVRLQRRLDKFKKLRQSLTKKEEEAKSLSAEHRGTKEKLPKLVELLVVDDLIATLEILITSFDHSF